MYCLVVNYISGKKKSISIGNKVDISLAKLLSQTVGNRLLSRKWRIYIYELFYIKGDYIMMKTKPVYNYDLEQVNALFKRGVFPIGIGVNNKTGNTYVVFKANMRYFDTLKLIEFEQKENQCVSNDKNLLHAL